MELNNQSNKQDNLLQQQAHDNFLRCFETVALIANLRDELGRKLDYVLNESTENRLSSEQIRLKLVEIKAHRDIITYVQQSKSITRSKP